MDNTMKHKGLSQSQVEESRQKFGDNTITERKQDSLFKLFLEKFNDPMIKILLVAACLSLVISVLHNEYAETIGIFCAIFLATGIAFWFEMDARKKFNALNAVSDTQAIKVMRDGVICQIPKSEIVVGDVVLFEAGDEIPADGILLDSRTLLINESTLTGELSVSKTTNEAEFDKEATYPSNWVYRSCKVLEGVGMMEVKMVGDKTQFGVVAGQASEISSEPTPLTRQLDSLADFIGIIGFVIAIATFFVLFFKDLFFSENIFSSAQIATIMLVVVSLFVLTAKVMVPVFKNFLAIMKIKLPFADTVGKWSWKRNILHSIVVFVAGSVVLHFGGFADILSPQSWISIDEVGRIVQFFMVAVTLIVVAVPEGLPMSVTLSLAMSMRRMLKTNNLVRKMHACETMGATTVVCTDKTGTLTKNQMQVYACFWNEYEKFNIDEEYSKLIAESIAMNTTAFLDFSDSKKIGTIGNPTESALLLWANEQGLNIKNLRGESDVIDRLLFSTERKYMASLIKSSLLGKNILLVKGAPEIVMSKSSMMYTPNGLKPISESVSKNLLEMQSKAMRTLGFAFKVVDESVREVENDLSDLTFLGFAAISDPLRDDIQESINECLNARIAVKIVTGDTESTAKEIARQIGLWKENDDSQNIITGIDFENLSDEEALARVQKLKIMCRARPSDKQRLVSLLQQCGETVAVTGDGTNDAPALNKAHVGLSMGTGTSIAKDASDITLLDDSFASIVSAVVWGRSLYLNIQRFIVFQLTINFTALLVVLLGSVFGHGLPLTVTQMLWVNLIMDTFAAGALASLPPSRNLLKNAPRDSHAFIITRNMSKNILSVGMVFVVALLAYMIFIDDNSVLSLTKFFTIFVMMQFWNIFNAKAFSTNSSAFSNLSQSKGFVLVSILILVGQYFIVTYGGEVFRTVPMSWSEWLTIFIATSPILLVGELYRMIVRLKK